MSRPKRNLLPKRSSWHLNPRYANFSRLCSAVTVVYTVPGTASFSNIFRTRAASLKMCFIYCFVLVFSRSFGRNEPIWELWPIGFRLPIASRFYDLLARSAFGQAQSSSYDLNRKFFQCWLSNRQDCAVISIHFQLKRGAC